MDFRLYASQVSDNLDLETVPTQFPPASSPTSVRVVEPNRSTEESTETRLYGSYQNTHENIMNEPAPPVTIRRPTQTDTTNPPTSNSRPTQIDTSNPPVSIPLSRVPMPDFIADRTMQTAYPMNYDSYDVNTMDSYPSAAVPSYRITMPDVYDDEFAHMLENEKDLEYFQQLHPMICRKLKGEIEEECDKLEYEGSYMYDEYPDRTTIRRTVNQIYNSVKDMDDYKSYLPGDRSSNEDSVGANSIRYSGCCPSNPLNELIELMFLNEMYQRRCRYRCRRRFWY